jgi:hypothetical protein
MLPWPRAWQKFCSFENRDELIALAIELSACVMWSLQIK